MRPPIPTVRAWLAPFSLFALVLSPAVAGQSLEIAPTDEALTFAAFEDAGGRHLLAVRSYDAEKVAGVLLDELRSTPGDDAIDLHRALGHAELRARIEAAHADAVVEVPLSALVLPVRLGGNHVAAGTNFAEHAEEAAVEDGPFLFSKQAEPTPWRSELAVGDALLDYEVELAFVTLEPIPLDRHSDAFGLILANDFTDRALLLRHVDPEDVTSGQGFTTGKSAPGYLPVGNLFVIPADPRRFVERLELSLEVNGESRQRAPMTLAIWDLDEMLAQTKARADVTWEHRGQQVRLPIEGGAIPERTLLLTGTPGGTVFRGIPTSSMVSGALDWLFGGWERAVAQHVVDHYVAAARDDEIYLQPGDVVTIRVDRMGEIRTSIVE